MLSFPLDTNPTIEITWAACVTSCAKILLGACYRPPDADSSFSTELCSNIERATQLFSADVIYLFGDFNYPLIDWSALSSTCRASSDFLELTLDFNLSQVVNQCTRGSNILDLVLTTAPKTTGPISYIEGFSDHRLLNFYINLPLNFSGSAIKFSGL